MKTFNILFAVLLICSAGLFAQNRQFMDTPFGVGGGYQAGWQFTGTEDLNNRLTASGFPALTTDGIFTSGGGGFIYVQFIPGLRIGGMASGGSVSESMVSAGIEHEALLSVSGGGLTIEYTLPFIKGVGVSVGGVIGAGQMRLELYKNSSTADWNGLWNDISSPNSPNIHRTVSNDYWHFSPTLMVDVPFYRFLAFRIGGGYQLTFADSWTLGNDKDLSGVPSQINDGNFFLQAGIFVGFFSY